MRVTIAEPAPAKINLALHIRRRRDDGYHEVETLFAFARDGDIVTIAPADQDSFSITGPFAAGLDPADDNLVTRAAAAFREALDIDAPHAITLDKRLPIASGIGGGSADAAATLRALATLHGIAIDDPRLAAIALPLGADVPACLLGVTTEGSGVGELLTPIDGLPGTPLLLVNPRVAVPTGAVFRGWDGIDRGAAPERRPARPRPRRPQRSRATRPRAGAGDRRGRGDARRRAGRPPVAHVGLGRDLLRAVR